MAFTRSRQIPPLENGDRLTRHEFEHHYAASSLEKAELIEGVVYVPAALRFESHANPHGHLITWLGVYETFTPGVYLGIEPTIRLDEDNEPQPDGVLLISEAARGRSRITADDYIEGPPELVIEIAASSVSIDLHGKKNAYRRNGVQEYLVWQIFENKLDWFSLQQGTYQPLDINPEGTIKSQVFPGLWLAVTALLRGDMQQVLATVQEGLGAPEHHAFVQTLADAQRKHNNV